MLLSTRRSGSTSLLADADKTKHLTARPELVEGRTTVLEPGCCTSDIDPRYFLYSASINPCLSNFSTILGWMNCAGFAFRASVLFDQSRIVWIPFAVG